MTNKQMREAFEKSWELIRKINSVVLEDFKPIVESSYTTGYEAGYQAAMEEMGKLNDTCAADCSHTDTTTAS